MKIPKKITIFLLFSIGFSSYSVADLKCPSKNFKTFFNAYSEQPNLQKRFAAEPLLYSSVVPVDDGHELVTEIIPQSEFQHYPFVKSKAERKQDGNVLTLLEHVQGSKKAKAILYIKDSNYLINYWFVFKRDCWYLTHYENHVF